MSLAHRRARRRGMIMGAALASSRSNKRAAAASQAPQSVDPTIASSESVAGNDSIEQLKKLAELHQQGILTDEEFAAKKKQLLGI